MYLIPWPVVDGALLDTNKPGAALNPHDITTQYLRATLVLARPLFGRLLRLNPDRTSVPDRGTAWRTVWLAAVRPRLLDPLGTCGELRQDRASQLHPDELVVQPSRHTPSSAAILQQRRTRFDSWQKVPQRPFSPARQTTAWLFDTVEQR